ncbi:MAG: hypothetical protein KDD02_09345 [Phaeodactylibacter sp.]|nr:hypothetical protein [Phaeodactylibacter sp.]MCB9300888.1 hypothetical protein [Lewinellaceae bacterium]HQU61000.1 hypothetical protein [Saprospiraceae bacterium]
MKKAWFLLAGMLSVLLYNACTKEYLQSVNPVCFEQDVLPIFVSNCTQSGCHNSQSRASGYVLDTYEHITSKGINPGDYKSSQIFKVLVGKGEGQMPQSPYSVLSDEQISTIALWIDEGAEKTTCSGGACDTTNVTYAQTIRPIIQNYCNGCHSGPSPSGNISYSDYAGLKTTANNGKLLGSIEHAQGYSPMPQNGNKLSACNIALIRAWVNAGAPNN